VRSETIKAVEILETGELFLALDRGDPSYQYVYREAAGVYWDDEHHGFKSTEMKEWSAASWFSHIVTVVEQGLGVRLSLGRDVRWNNVPAVDRQAIEAQFASPLAPG